jgi:alkylation response protein AidB-like acyl-CoA dehydrogenase
MFVDLLKAEIIAYRAAWLINEGLPYTKEAYMAKAQLNETYQNVARLATQIHGGIGVIKEHDVQLYTRRAKAAESFWGDVEFCREKIAEECLDR